MTDLHLQVVSFQGELRNPSTSQQAGVGLPAFGFTLEMQLGIFAPDKMKQPQESNI